MANHPGSAQRRTLDGPVALPTLDRSGAALCIGGRSPFRRLRLALLRPAVGPVGSREWRLGVRRCRRLASNGDLVARLVRWIDPDAFPRAGRDSLVKREAETRDVERFHSAELLGLLTTAVWAVLVGQSWFAV